MFFKDEVILIKKLLIIFASVVTIIILSAYIWCFVEFYNEVIPFRAILSVLCIFIAIIAVLTLLLSSYIDNLFNLIRGFRFEILQLAIVAAILSFVIITV